jgi:signal transduction histidine kinase
MRLRLRLALTTVSVVVPIGLLLLWYDGAARDQKGAEALAGDMLEYMQAGGRAQCEADPQSWGGPLDSGDGPPWLPAPRPLEVPWQPPLAPHQRPARAPVPPGSVPKNLRWRGGPPPILFAYDERLQSLNPHAPQVAEPLAAAVRSGRALGARRIATDGRTTLQVLMRMPWSGSCALVLACAPGVPKRFQLAALRFWIVPLGLFIAAVLISVGPVVRRIRRLTRAVQRSASAGYASLGAVGGADELGDLARAFDEAGLKIRDQLAEKERREQALRHFLENTTHDLMIPLTVLQGHLSALRQRRARGEPVDSAVLTSAMDEAHYMGSLIHNLAIAAKLDVAELELHRGPVDLNALVARVIGRHKPIADQHGVTLESAVPEQPLVVIADLTLLEQAVSNVVHNAIRHNRAGGHVALLLEGIGAERFRVRVVDDGPGIPPAELTRLVERGFRGTAARTREIDGHGIGLNITSRIVELHGFALAFQSSEYGGLQVDLSGASVANAD